MAIHKGTELSNVNETWRQNERINEGVPAAGNESALSATNGEDEIQRIVKEEAAAYDNANKEERLLGGDRASVNDTDE